MGAGFWSFYTVGWSFGGMPATAAAATDDDDDDDIGGGASFVNMMYIL